MDKKAEKAASVADITARLKASSTAVLADYRGMTVGQMRDLRSKLRGGGIEMIVVKNTLLSRLLGAMQAPLGKLASILQAPMSTLARTLDAVRTQKESQSPAAAPAAS